MLLTLVLFAASCAGQTVFDFENAASGQIPAGWTAAVTHGEGNQPATWTVLTDSTSNGGPRVLALTDPGQAGKKTFNLCWTQKALLENGTVSMDYRSHGGKTEQGAGLLWRVQDADNYYVAWDNPYTRLLQVMVVANGRRIALRSMKHVEIPLDQWHTLTVRCAGRSITVFLNGEKKLELTDDTILKPGGAGVWAPADAVTSFDKLIVQPEK
jgi:hypothetical protein